MFAILQKYDFSSKSQQDKTETFPKLCCLRYCKSTIFQANHNRCGKGARRWPVVCDTAKVRFFKQITTWASISAWNVALFAILQKYDFSSKSQLGWRDGAPQWSCLRYCKSTIFQANHNCRWQAAAVRYVVCDTAKVRFFKQITTLRQVLIGGNWLFAILQKYDFSSKSQPPCYPRCYQIGCLRYCKSTIFQANHNFLWTVLTFRSVVCDTAKVRFFKQITTA